MKLMSIFESLELNDLREFLLQKWKERAKSLGRTEPNDLSGACKFVSLFIHKILGGEIKGNYHHQYVVMNNKIIDPTNGDGVKIKNPYYHDSKFWLNPEHISSINSCEPRVSQWVKEYQESL